MVEDRITNGKRIGQLLASELTGLESGSLAAVEVADADRDAEPTPDGAFAYAVEYRGERVGVVEIFEERARLTLSVGDAVTDDEVGGDGLAVTETQQGLHVDVESGAAVKRAVDVLVDALGD